MWCFWSAKGGVGCTVVTTALALGLAETTPTLIVDLAGDVAALLGRPSCDVGLARWLAAPAPPPDALSRLEREVAPNLALLSWGPEPDPGSGSEAVEPISEPVEPTDRAEILARLVDFDARNILVDIGVRGPADGRRSLIGEYLLSLASRSTLVTRACYLAMRAAEPWPPPDDVVLVARQGRALRAGDVAAAVGAPVAAELPVGPCGRPGGRRRVVRLTNPALAAWPGRAGPNMTPRWRTRLPAARSVALQGNGAIGPGRSSAAEGFEGTDAIGAGRSGALEGFEPGRSSALEETEAIEAVRAEDPLLPLAEARARAEERTARHHRFGPIGRFLADDLVTEVMINGPGPVWVERAGELACTGTTIGSYEIELLIERVLTPLGLRVDRTAPIVDARLADGSRVNVVVPPLAVDGPAVSIRRFPSVPIRLSSFGPPAMARTLSALMAERASILVVGPTSSGKTTLLNALSRLIGSAERVVCIEDTAELRLAADNVVRLEARPANSEGVGEVSLRRLVLNALRMRPDRLVVGEVRGPEALDLLLALTSGHRGCLTSCHGADGPAAIRRLETLASLAGTALAAEHIQQLIHDGLDAVVTTDRIGHRRLVVAIDEVGPRRLTNRWSATRPVAPERQAC